MSGFFKKIFEFQGENWAERGCSLDVSNPNWNRDLENVIFCAKSGCNAENILYSTCISCNSSLSGKCASIANPETLIKTCKGKYPYVERGCFTMVKSM